MTRHVVDLRVWTMKSTGTTAISDIDWLVMKALKIYAQRVGFTLAVDLYI